MKKELETERERLQILETFSIVGSDPEAEYDSITKIASEISQSPLAQINLIDATTQYSKSSLGLPYNVIPREFAFCNHTIQHPFELTVVPDMRLDQRFKNHPAVKGEPHLQFYAGVPLTTPEGYALGSLCVMDMQPRELTKSQVDMLKALAVQVVVNLQLRRNNIILNEQQRELKSRYKDLEQFSYVVSHDLKSPLNNIISLVQLLRKHHQSQLDSEGLQMMEYLRTSSDRLKKLIDGILEFYRGDQIVSIKKEDIELTTFLKEVASLHNPLNAVQFQFPEGSNLLHVNKVALEQIFLNLFVNAIKYNDKEKVIITVSFSQDESHYYFTVKDNGIGISEAHLQEIFKLFTNLNVRDKNGDLGTGIGLSTVKKLVEKLSGVISVTSEPAIGTSFSFSIKR